MTEIASTSRSFDGKYQQKHLEAPGVRFVPTDEELITDYLDRKLHGQRPPTSIVKECDVYALHPRELGRVTYRVEGSWYVFSPRDRKYANGSRPRRSTGPSGFWKATSANEVILSSVNKTIGQKRALAFYEGEYKTRVKTEWKMVEYVSDKSDKPAGAAADSMLLNDWVLCKISCREDSKCNNVSSQHNQEYQYALVSVEEQPPIMPDSGYYEDEAEGLHAIQNDAEQPDLNYILYDSCLPFGHDMQ